MSKKPAHTAAQVVAADPTQPVWVSANAGTGKTHVLIERILRLLLAGTPPGKILCLTYTKAAAAEVATRLSTRLGHWSAGSGKALASDLKKLLGKPASTMATETARKLFAATLETPEGLRIRTIHSFSESLLGRFPVEAKLAPHFSVLDERRAREIRIEARDRLLSGGAAAGPAGAAWLWPAFLPSCSWPVSWVQANRATVEAINSAGMPRRNSPLIQFSLSYRDHCTRSGAARSPDSPAILPN